MAIQVGDACPQGLVEPLADGADVFTVARHVSDCYTRQPVVFTDGEVVDVDFFQ